MMTGGGGGRFFLAVRLEIEGVFTSTTPSVVLVRIGDVSAGVTFLVV